MKGGLAGHCNFSILQHVSKLNINSIYSDIREIFSQGRVTEFNESARNGTNFLMAISK